MSARDQSIQPSACFIVYTSPGSSVDQPNTLVREGGKNTLVSINYPNTLVHGGKNESVKTLRIPAMPTPGTPGTYILQAGV